MVQASIKGCLLTLAQAMRDTSFRADKPAHLQLQRDATHGAALDTLHQVLRANCRRTAQSCSAAAVRTTYREATVTNDNWTSTRSLLFLVSLIQLSAGSPKCFYKLRCTIPVRRCDLRVVS